MNQPTPLVLCRQCDWLMRLPARAPAQGAHCPRCGYHIAAPAQPDMVRLLAWALATLIVLGLVFAFDFLRFSAYGVGHAMSFLDASRALFGDDYPWLALLVIATTALAPGVYLACLALLCVSARRAGPPAGLNRWAVRIARVLQPLEPWMMSDVFIVGVLVALVKIVTLAEIHIGLSFVAFCVYSLMLLRTLTLIDWLSIWPRLTGASRAMPGRAGRTGASQHLIACRVCAAPIIDRAGQCCPRCGGGRGWRGVDRNQLTLALLATAIIAYIPANLYPVLTTATLGNTQPQTIVAGVIHLYESGSWPIAGVIFVASIIVPISKIIALGWLCLGARPPTRTAARHWLRIYRFTEKIGRWSMIDVFVVAVLGALVQAGALMAITPGPGALAFALVVVITMIAARTYDPRTLWPATADAATP